MRSDIYANGEFYHVYNRGVDKRIIFIDDEDYHRFLKTCIFSNTSQPHNRSISKLNEVVGTGKLVNIHAYCLMQNHYHLLLEQLVDGGITKFMQRFGNAYTKYFNIRHDRSGRLFQNVFQIQHIHSNAYFEYLQSYIHLNSMDLENIHTFQDLIDYRWSSLKSFLNDESSFIEKQKILSLYRSSSSMKSYIHQQFQHHRLEKEKEEKLG